MFGEIGKLLIFMGVALAVAGLLFTLVPFLRLGRLPGDIVIKRENWSVYLPVTTSILISMALSLLLWIVSLFRR